jgi:hypothetical protein
MHLRATTMSFLGQSAYARCTPEIHITSYSGVQLTDDPQAVTCRYCLEWIATHPPTPNHTEDQRG